MLVFQINGYKCLPIVNYCLMKFNLIKGQSERSRGNSVTRISMILEISTTVDGRRTFR